MNIHAGPGASLPQSFLYCIAPARHDAGPCKIGISVNPDRRLRELQTAHPEPLAVRHRECLDAERVRLYERLIHRDIGYTRTQGEWFAISVAEAIAHIQFTIIHYGNVEHLARKMRRGHV